MTQLGLVRSIDMLTSSSYGMHIFKTLPPVSPSRWLSLLVSNRVYRLETQSAMLEFSVLWPISALTFSLVSSPHFLTVRPPQVKSLNPLAWGGGQPMSGQVACLPTNGRLPCILCAQCPPPHTDTLPRGVFKKFPILHQLALPKPCFLASLTSPLPGEIGEHISYFPCL